MTLERLIEEALMTKIEVANEAGLSAGTVSRMVNGRKVARLSALKVLYVLGQKLGRRIDISEIEGLDLSDD